MVSPICLSPANPIRIPANGSQQDSSLCCGPVRGCVDCSLRIYVGGRRTRGRHAWRSIHVGLWCDVRFHVQIDKMRELRKLNARRNPIQHEDAQLA